MAAVVVGHCKRGLSQIDHSTWNLTETTSPWASREPKDSFIARGCNYYISRVRTSARTGSTRVELGLRTSALDPDLRIRVVPGSANPHTYVG